MDRKTFLKSLAIMPLLHKTLPVQQLERSSNLLSNSDRMPVLFLGHGSPMNAIEENQFVAGFRNVSKQIERPNAILCISAHWETKGSYVTAMSSPKTIHDFGGFPQELYQVEYPAPGSPELAQSVRDEIHMTSVGFDHDWGLDHGSWSVVKHLYPDADVPIIQMSIDYTKPPQYHYDLARQLAALRKKGVLIIGSGNIVHNLRMVAWHKMSEDNYAFDWANEASERIKDLLLNKDHQPLVNYYNQGSAFKLAIPTPEHYLPLIYTLGLQETKDEITIFNDKAVGGSLTMTSVKIG